MSTITIECKNKTLTIVDSPSIDIGGVNSLQFSFCPLWDGYSKTVHFYKNETDCNPVEIVNNLAEIPSGLISEGASFFFFVDGVSGELKRRSQIFKCKIESSLLVVENADSDVQIRLIDLVENLKNKNFDFDYSSLTDEEKAQIKQDVTTINAQFSKVYNVSGEQSVFPIDIERYAHGLDILEVYINGMRLVEGIDYSNDGQRITLTKPLNVIGQLEIVVFKSVSANVADWDSFKGEQGERGEAGKDGVSISSVVQTKTSTDDDGNNEITVTLSNGQKSTFTVQNGSQGSQGIRGETGSTGNGISSITVSESTADGENNVVTISMTDGTSKTFNVKNGSKGADGSSGGGSSDVSLKLIAGSENATGSGGYDTNSDSDINAFIETGVVKWAKYRNISGLPNGDGLVQSIGWRSPVDGAGWGRQIAYDDESHNIYSRYMGNGSWSGWTKVLVDGDVNLGGYVPTSRTINNKVLTGNISLSASDVGAVPTSRTVNGKALSGNITLSASDVGASPKPTYLHGKGTLASMSVGEIKIIAMSGTSSATITMPSGGQYIVGGVETSYDSTVETDIGYPFSGVYSGGASITTSGYGKWCIVLRIS